MTVAPASSGAGSLPPAGAPHGFSTEKALGVALGAAVVAGLLIWVPILRPLAYPFRLLTTLVHELAHGLAALATGGRFLRFVVHADGSGVALTSGGWRFVVIAAGYLGAALFGAVLIRLAASPGARRWALGVVGLACALLSLRYGVPSLFSDQLLSGLLTTTSGVLLGGGCVALALRASEGWVLFVIHLIAFQAGLTSLADLLTLASIARGGAIEATDAHAMAELTFLPALFWAFLWGLMAVLLLGAAMWSAWRRWEREP